MINSAMGSYDNFVPPNVIVDPFFESWLREDIGRGDRSTLGAISLQQRGTAIWVAKAAGVVAGLPFAKRVFQTLDPQATFRDYCYDGDRCQSGDTLLEINSQLVNLLMAERTALNLTMRLSGIATATAAYVERLSGYPTRLVDTRKTTPGLRIFEKYATVVGGGTNHRWGLDDAAMIKDNHIVAAGGIDRAIVSLRQSLPYPLKIEVETEDLTQVATAIEAGADIIMLDNMSVPMMQEAVRLIRAKSDRIAIEASGNITLERLAEVAATGIDYISTSAPITRSPWLDISMRLSH
jgi:nicotinate-nucleotide pyrophosphorylase (carboxylating)